STEKQRTLTGAAQPPRDSPRQRAGGRGARPPRPREHADRRPIADRLPGFESVRLVGPLFYLPVNSGPPYGPKGARRPHANVGYAADREASEPGRSPGKSLLG